VLALGFVFSHAQTAELQAAPNLAEPEVYSARTPNRHTLRYIDYREMHRAATFTGDRQTLGSADMVDSSSNVVVEEFEGRNAIITEETGFITFNVTIPRSGWYAISIDYFPIVEHVNSRGEEIRGTGGSIERTVFIDGEIPFDEAFALEMTRIFVDEIELDEYGVPIPITGNRFRPRQEERPRWNTVTFRDQFGYFGRALYFFLEEGERQITLRSVSEAAAISGIELVSESFQAPSYAEFIETMTAMGVRPVSGVLEGGMHTIPAEVPYEKGDPTLMAFNDTLSTRTYPHDPRVRRMNAIGGEMWQFPNQWITYYFYAPEAGFYNITFRARQNFQRDINSNRTILINGELQFEEAAYVEFAFGSRHNGWRTVTLGDNDGNAFYFFFEQGRNYITIQNTVGEVSETLIRAQYVLDNLSRINLRLVSFMTASPDRDRDFHLDRRMPYMFWELRPGYEQYNLRYNARIVREIMDEMIERNGGRTDSLTAQLRRLAMSIETLADRPHRVARNYGQFRDQLLTFGLWGQTVREQALVLDRIVISEPGVEVNIREDNFFDRFWAMLIAFINSFFTNFSMINEGVEGDYITVWIGGITGGRDQAMALNSMVMRDFTPVYGIPVNLQLVGTGVVLVATLAGRGPDITLSVGTGEPVDFALRNAVVDLTRFMDYGFEEVVGTWHPEHGEFRGGRFFPGSILPFQFNNEYNNAARMGPDIPGVFALPETIVWPMMFYRIDVLQDIGIDPARDLRSWQNIRERYPELLAQNMEFGLGNTLPIFTMFLYQAGGQLYRDGLVGVNFDDPLTLEMFRYYTSFFLEIGMPRDFDFVNRFRTGEMPIAIADYTQFNMISIFAPELRGRWAMVPVPGMYVYDPVTGERLMGEDGLPLIDRTVAPGGLVGGVGGAIMMHSAVSRGNHYNAWQFLKWWTDAQAQFNFGRQLEAVMGAAARHPTANMEAFEMLPWGAAARQALNEQAQYIRGIPEAPGGYYVGRHFTFAMNDVLADNVNQRMDARQRLLRATIYVNNEITRRRTEFGLTLMD